MLGAKGIKAALFALIVLPLAACGTTSDAKDRGPDDGPAKAESSDSGKPGVVARVFGAKEKSNPGPCPLMGVLYDASRMVEFEQAGERYANIGWTGEITGVRGLCTYYDATPIEMNMDIDMAFGRGPMAGSDTRTYRYWVAVTRTDVAPIAKQYFDVTVKFPKGANAVTHVEKIKKIVIPRANAEIAGTAFEILVGFDLTPEELAYNRAGKRFKANAGQN
jgi:hypothetical protein